MSQYQTTRVLATSVLSTRRTSLLAKASSVPPPAVMSCVFTSRSTPTLVSSAMSSSRLSAAALPCEYLSPSTDYIQKPREAMGARKTIRKDQRYDIDITQPPFKRERRQNNPIDISQPRQYFCLRIITEIWHWTSRNPPSGYTPSSALLGCPDE